MRLKGTLENSQIGDIKCRIVPTTLRISALSWRVSSVQPSCCSKGTPKYSSKNKIFHLSHRIIEIVGPQLVERFPSLCSRYLFQSGLEMVQNSYVDIEEKYLL